jgi:hypothetical protein
MAGTFWMGSASPDAPGRSGALLCTREEQNVFRSSVFVFAAVQKNTLAT